MTHSLFASIVQEQLVRTHRFLSTGPAAASNVLVTDAISETEYSRMLLRHQ